jgi:peptidoglycan/LPS O-acetylase OafA/YrhL
MDHRASRFPHIDSLRAIAAIAVLGTHAAIFAGADQPGSTTGHYAQRLEVGVAIFFVISGFLLYRPFAAARAGGTAPPQAAPYAWRRSLRIVPAYWLALTLSALILGTSGVLTLPGGLRFFGFAQIYHEPTIPGGLTQAWTLCIEVLFYAFLPVWAWAMRRTGRSLRAEVAGLAGLAAFSVVWKVAVLSGMNAHKIRVTPLLISFPAYLDQFALGMGLAVFTLWLDQRATTPRGVALIDRFPGASWLVALVAFWVVSMKIGIGDHLFEPMSRTQYLERHELYAVIGIAMVLPAVVGQPGRGLVRKVLANRVLLWLGVVSYGIYLWQLTVLDELHRRDFSGIGGIDPYVAWFLVGLAATAVVAAASWYGLERPLLALRNVVGPQRVRITRLGRGRALPAADDRAAP